MEKKIIVKHIDTAEWIERANKKTGSPHLFQELIVDEDTGMFVRHSCYPAGTVTPKHTHHCAHGIYVLSGTLHTHEGNYPPGSFVWFPEGVAAEHGATPEEDMHCIFITNKPFDISYEPDK